MEQWSASLRVQCDACHVVDRERLGQDGDPLLNFADDHKPMKTVARVMYAMTEAIKSKYLAKIDRSGVPVNCATCHRGHMGPEAFPLPAQERIADPQAQPANGEVPPSQ